MTCRLLTWTPEKQQAYQKNNKHQYLTIHFLMDRSFSMHQYIGDVLEGYNRYLSHIRRLNPPNCFWELSLFNEQPAIRPVVALGRALSLTRKTYVPEGGTALYDALGCLLSRDQEYTRHLLIIMSDGEDNMSQRWKPASCEEIVKTLQDIEGWTFVWLAAYEQGRQAGLDLGIPDDNCLVFPGDAFPDVFKTLTEQTTKFLAGRDPVKGYLPSAKFFGE